MMHYLAQTYAKPEEQHQNQDAYQPELAQDASAGYHYFALSDGAGGYGIFSGDWARALVKHIQPKPIQTVEELDEWIGSWCEKFMEEVNKKANAQSYLQTKLYKEGSAATLVAVWIEPEQKKIHLLSYGDSFYALLLGDQVYFPNQRDQFIKYQQNPHLLNWLEEKSPPAGFSHRELTYENEFKLLVCSDAVGQFALALWEKEQHEEGAHTALISHYRGSRILQQETWTWAKLWQELPRLLGNSQQFEDWIKSLYAQELLEEDDCTAVFLQVSNAPVLPAPEPNHQIELEFPPE